MPTKIEIKPNDQSWLGKKIRQYHWGEGFYLIPKFIGEKYIFGAFFCQNGISLETMYPLYGWELYEEEQEKPEYEPGPRLRCLLKKSKEEKPLHEVLTDIAKQIPKEELDNLPSDFAEKFEEHKGEKEITFEPGEVLVSPEGERIGVLKGNTFFNLTNNNFKEWLHYLKTNLGGFKELPIKGFKSINGIVKYGFYSKEETLKKFSTYTRIPKDQAWVEPGKKYLNLRIDCIFAPVKFENNAWVQEDGCDWKMDDEIEWQEEIENNPKKVGRV